MKNIFALLMLIALFGCNNKKESVDYIRYKNTYFATTDSSFLFKSDSLYAEIPELAKEDCFYVFDKDSIDCLISNNDTIYSEEWSKGDTLYYFHKGDTLFSRKIDPGFDIEMIPKSEGLWVASKLGRDFYQINLTFKEAIYNHILRRYTTRNNVGLDFYKKENGKYYYFSSWDNFAKGGRNLESIKLKYRYSLLDESDINLHADTIRKYLNQFILHLN